MFEGLIQVPSPEDVVEFRTCMKSCVDDLSLSHVYDNSVEVVLIMTVGRVR